MRRLGPVLAANLREAMRSLVRARLRTLLGLIGIMIGIASVIAMVSMGEIATAQSRKQFEALGTDIVTIKTQGQARGAGIALEDALALADALPSIAAAAPVIRASGSFTHAGKRVGSGSMQGVTASFATSTSCGSPPGASYRTWISERSGASSAPRSPPPCAGPAPSMCWGPRSTSRGVSSRW